MTMPPMDQSSSGKAESSGDAPLTNAPGNNAPATPPEPELPAWARRRAGGDALPEREFALYIGQKWDGTYRRKFRPFLEDASFVPTWNWSAAFVPPLWFLYRKLYLGFAVFFILPGFAVRWLTGSDAVLTMQTMQLPENQSLVWMSMAVLLSSSIAAGGTANWILFRRARAATQLVRMQQLPEAESTLLLQRWGGVNRTGTALFILFSLVLSAAQLGA
jgi:hypothetical protein